MNEILIGSNPDKPQIVGMYQPAIQEKATQLPKPVGYKILCAIPEADEKIDGSELVKAAETMRNEEILTTVLFVVDCLSFESTIPLQRVNQTGSHFLVGSGTLQNSRIFT